MRTLSDPSLRLLLAVSLLLAGAISLWLLATRGSPIPRSVHRATAGHTKWVSAAFLVLAAGTIYAVAIVAPPFPPTEVQGRGIAAGLALAGTIIVATPLALYHSWASWSEPTVRVLWITTGVFLLVGTLAVYVLDGTMLEDWLPILPLVYAFTLGALAGYGLFW